VPKTNITILQNALLNTTQIQILGGILLLLQYLKIIIVILVKITLFNQVFYALLVKYSSKAIIQACQKTYFIW